MAGKVILIVDDNAKNVKLVRDVLEFKGYVPLVAETGEAAVALAITLNFYNNHATVDVDRADELKG